MEKKVRTRQKTRKRLEYISCGSPVLYSAGKPVLTWVVKERCKRLGKGYSVARFAYSYTNNQQL